MPYRCHIVAAKTSKTALFSVFMRYYESWSKMGILPMKTTIPGCETSI
jgi:hypothetical protein